DTIEEGFDAAYAASVAGLPGGNRIGMLTVSGGAGVLMADAAAAGGLEAPELPQPAQEKIRARVAFAATRNPVDVTGQIVGDPDLLPWAMQLMLQDGAYDSVVTFLAAAGLSPQLGPFYAQLLIDAKTRFPDRVFAVSSL